MNPIPSDLEREKETLWWVLLGVPKSKVPAILHPRSKRHGCNYYWNVGVNNQSYQHEI